MKRLLVGLGAVCVLVLPACGDDSSGTTTTMPTTTTTAPTTTATTTTGPPVTTTHVVPPPLTTTHVVPPPLTPTTIVPPPLIPTTIVPPAQPTSPAADGSTGNGLSAEYCAKNEDPGCPAGSYIGPDAIPNPNGDGTWVPCEGTICTNPNRGGG